MDNVLELPEDWGRRVRAARAYTQKNPSVKKFAAMLASPGMSYSALRRWEDGGTPTATGRAAIVQRLAEVSGLPPAFFTADLSGLFEDVPEPIRAQLAALQQSVDSQREAVEALVAQRADLHDAIAGMSPEDVVAYFQEILRNEQEILNRLGERVGKRDLEQRAVRSRAGADLPPEAPEVAA